MTAQPYASIDEAHDAAQTFIAAGLVRPDQIVLIGGTTTGRYFAEVMNRPDGCTADLMLATSNDTAVELHRADAEA